MVTLHVTFDVRRLVDCEVSCFGGVCRARQALQDVYTEREIEARKCKAMPAINEKASAAVAEAKPWTLSMPFRKISEQDVESLQCRLPDVFCNRPWRINSHSLRG